MTKPLCVLVIGDNETDAQLLIRELRHIGFDVETEAGKGASFILSLPSNPKEPSNGV